MSNTRNEEMTKNLELNIFWFNWCVFVWVLMVVVVVEINGTNPIEQIAGAG